MQPKTQIVCTIDCNVESILFCCKQDIIFQYFSNNNYIKFNSCNLRTYVTKQAADM
jgi:hypothetical protein